MRISQRAVFARGLTLVELLIALALGLSMAAGAVQIFAWNHQLDLRQQAHGRMQENARFALNFMMQEIRMAANSAHATVPQTIQGWEADSALDTTADSALESSTGGHWTSQGSSVLVSFLAVPGSDMVQIWLQQADNDTLTSVLFYVGKRGNQPDNPPALFQRRFSTSSSPTAAEELVEGVRSMQLLYGLTTDTADSSAVGTYVPADLVSDWKRINSVRLTLLMHSGLRQVQAREFSTTVAIRNRAGNANISLTQ